MMWVHRYLLPNADSSEGGVSEGYKFVQAGRRRSLRSTKSTGPGCHGCYLHHGYVCTCMDVSPTHPHLPSCRPRCLQALRWWTLWAGPASNLGGCGYSNVTGAAVSGWARQATEVLLTNASQLPINFLACYAFPAPPSPMHLADLSHSERILKFQGRANASTDVFKIPGNFRPTKQGASRLQATHAV